MGKHQAETNLTHVLQIVNTAYQLVESPFGAVISTPAQELAVDQVSCGT
jgi:hypothetical protein